MKISIFNLGCKVNQYECDVIAEKLIFSGYNVTQNLEKADIFILNTCAVTAEAERKSRQAIARCRNISPYARIYVLGCASQKSPQSFIKEDVVYIGGTSGKFNIVNQINNSNLIVNVTDIPPEFENSTLSITNRTRAYVKIQDGCNNFCSYCIIPYLRGRSRSRDINSIVNEINLLSSKTEEIVLTGIDLMSFGKDNGTSLTDLMNQIKNIDIRIRLGSIYAEKITEELLYAMFSLKKFCPHFHLSLQSGDNTVLKDMNRHYTNEEYLEKIQLIRKYNNNSAITTDIIVGYPTETDINFNNTVSFVKEAEFSDLHIFPFSARKGTRAEKLTPINGEILKERKNQLLSIKKELSNAFLLKNIGIEHEVLVEESIDGFSIGYSRNYLKVGAKKIGNIIKVKPNKLKNNILLED